MQVRGYPLILAAYKRSGIPDSPRRGSWKPLADGRRSEEGVERGGGEGAPTALGKPNRDGRASPSISLDPKPTKVRPPSPSSGTGHASARR